jgi:hypothetical protein
MFDHRDDNRSTGTTIPDFGRFRNSRIRWISRLPFAIDSSTAVLALRPVIRRFRIFFGIVRLDRRDVTDAFSLKIASGYRLFVGGDILRSAGGYDETTLLGRTGTQVDDVIGGGHQMHIVLDDN